MLQGLGVSDVAKLLFCEGKSSLLPLHLEHQQETSEFGSHGDPLEILFLSVEMLCSACRFLC